MNSWILTFNRPLALNRQIHALKEWTNVHIFSNHPDIAIDEENTKDYREGKIKILFNTLSDPEATSYCARSWNNIFLKSLKNEEEVICIQDDTQITDPEKFRDLILTNKDKYDLIWGPAGDQFFYLKKKILQKVGWFDERYLGCYCGDADWLKRIWDAWADERHRLSISESHDWGFNHNSIGIERVIPTHIGAKAIDANYVNQHHEIEQKVGSSNPILEHSQGHWIKKWGKALNGNGPINQAGWVRHFNEIDWYPWFSKKYLN
jgi:hypothetical protein